MYEYIEKQTLLDAIDNAVEFTSMDWDAICVAVNKLPSIKTNALRIGHWQKQGKHSDILLCSICGGEAFWDSDFGPKPSKFCPHCGTRMENYDDWNW